MKIPKIAETLIQASNERDVEMYLSCFTQNAIYADIGEKETVVGKKAIEKNFREMKYEVHTEPTHIEETSDKITMKVKATGNFKGSPLHFEYQIKLQSGLIQDLKIDLI
ncbi:nuclear transport factor 2 family protein [Leptospira sp. 201903074]|uniref:Nuclear transport factor 2 n=1 Tax=Leptospira vanthielii serovar Holland str. Waz Holland = ATCC 700522 TaxID=1218591 RepID=N1W9A6_9LEPT|nr:MULTISPECIES: nuclear transport factor 2 family protein [Leptospira]EMY70020.1 nuclear transport factor 2 [Leptospira vanthielii serovar Holland str. Waz Holland = ATCC 700522]MBM9546869.1 nuclear transport factor 2 family protein [Leptospira abararensis]